MDVDVLKREMEGNQRGESKRSGANSPMTTSYQVEGNKRNSWGFCSMQ